MVVFHSLKGQGNFKFKINVTQCRQITKKTPIPVNLNVTVSCVLSERRTFGGNAFLFNNTFRKVGIHDAF